MLRLLFCHTMVHLPALGGASKATRAIAESLAALGHECHVVVPSTGLPRPRDSEDFARELARSGADVVSDTPASTLFVLNGVHVHAIHDRSRSLITLRAHLEKTIGDLAPDLVVVGSEDPGLRLLGVAVRRAVERTVYFAQTTSFLPFGPACAAPTRGADALLGKIPFALTISRFLADYLRKWGGMEATVLTPPVFGDLPAEPDVDSDTRRLLTMVNPCVLKGIDLFVALARERSNLPFAAVPTWGTTQQDLDALRGANVMLLAPTSNVDELLQSTRILLVPSLWAEAFGYITIDAMVRGIPVVASDIGGLREAKLSVPYSVPVRGIEAHRAHDFSPIVPEQDLAPWIAAIDALTGDAAHYRENAAQSRSAASAFVARAKAQAFEDYFGRCVRAKT